MTMKAAEIRLSNDKEACTAWIEADMTLIGDGLIKVQAVARLTLLKKKPTHSEVRFAGQVVRQQLYKADIDALWPVNYLGTMTLSLPMSITLEANPSLELPVWATT